MLFVTVQYRPGISGQVLAVHPQMGITTLGGPLGQLSVNTFARHHQRRQQGDLTATILLLHPSQDSGGGLWLDGHKAAGAIVGSQYWHSCEDGIERIEGRTSEG